MNEELGLSPFEVEALTWQGVASGMVSSKTGYEYTAKWDVFTGSTHRSVETLAGDVHVNAVLPYELFRDPTITDLAKRAVWLYATR